MKNIIQLFNTTQHLLLILFTFSISSNSFAQCTPTGNSPGLLIDGVTINGISNLGTGWTDYTDYSAQLSNNLISGSSENITIEVNTPWTGNNNSFSVWVDWDQDNVFNTTNELEVNQTVNVTTSPFSLVAAITIPVTQASGNYRMRVGYSYWPFTPNDGCDTGGNREYEDYTLVVVAPTVFSYTSSTTTQTNTSNAPYCTTDQEIIGIEVVAAGNTGVFNMTEFQFNMNGSTAITDATNIDIFYTGNNPTFSAIGSFGTAVPAGGTITVNGTQQLVEGTNYFWIAYDMKLNTFTGGNTMDAECTQITVDGSNYIPSVINPGAGRTTETCPGAPGNVSSNFKFWLKANQIPLADGTNITTWSDQSGNLNDATQGNNSMRPVFRDNAANNINFNAVSEFTNAGGSANDDWMNFPVPATDDQNIFVVFATTQTTTDTWFYDVPLLYGGDINSSFVSGQADFAIAIGNNNAIFMGGGGNGDWGNTGTIPINTGLPIILELNRTDNNVNDMDLAWRINGANDGTHNETTDSCAWPMPSVAQNGLHATGAGDSYNGSIAETIVYEGVLTTLNRSKIESYLAIKYGVTLSQATPQDYVYSDGTTILWDASVVGTTYNNDITGISRDDLSAQNQKQSRSVNPGSLVTIGLGTISVTNSANTSSFASDGLTLMWSNDAASTAAWVTTEKPALMGDRISREWYVEENNGDVGAVTIEVADADLPATGGQIVHLLVDADGDFSVGAITIPMTLNSGIWSVSQNLIDGNYFTFARNPIPLPIELLSFTATAINNKTVQLDWITATEINNDFFTIERSIDAEHWENVLNTDGAGNSSINLTYQEFDNEPYMGTSYYRLKQTDFNGSYSYSQIEPVNFDGIEIINIYPIPANGSFNYIVNTNTDVHINIFIYDNIGRLIDQNQTHIKSGYNSLTHNISKLSEGNYHIRIITDDAKSYDQKMFVVN